MGNLRDLYWTLRYQWQLHYLLPLLLLLPLLVLCSRDPFDSYVERGEPVTAHITGLGASATKYQGRPPGLRVTARTAQGAVGSTIVLPAKVAGCKIGDPIRAEQKGIKLYLQPAPCPAQNVQGHDGEELQPNRR